jgi:two-component system, response regulator YesN
MKEAHILVVDDEPGLASALCRALDLLAGGECVSECVTSAQSALARLSEAPFDLLVTDFALPGMDGLTLIRHARQMRPEPPLRAVLITAYGEGAVEKTDLDQVDGYLPKPFSLGMFIRVVTNILEQDACNGA